MKIILRHDTYMAGSLKAKSEFFESHETESTIKDNDDSQIVTKSMKRSEKEKIIVRSKRG
ncbi:MAG: hypothetical protein N2647_05515 [Thermodesulfovibrio sp.]|nr:hypothetical protein [Thermodesulfovibrio sp.]